ncbi:RICIN domain-containing protein [Micromonosporaceae bacterium Da 78-11]
MTDDEGAGQDPLLVRRFLLDDPGADDTPSTQTWPAATTREVRSHHAFAADPPPAAPVPPARSSYRRRLLVLSVTGVAVLAAAGAAGYAALGAGLRPALSTGMPGAPLPAVTGPQPSSGPQPSGPVRSGPQPAGVGPSETGPRLTGSPRQSASSSGSASPRSSATSTAVPSGSSTAGNGTGTVDPVPPAGLAPDVTPARTGTISAQNGLCLDLNGGVPAEDNHVQVFDCNGSPAQLWTLASDGTLQVVGKCALQVGDGTVHIVGCDGRTTAKWRIVGRTLVNEAGDQCLTDPSNGTRSGAGATVARCSGATNQIWTLP